MDIAEHKLYRAFYYDTSCGGKNVPVKAVAFVSSFKYL